MADLIHKQAPQRSAPGTTAQRRRAAPLPDQRAGPAAGGQLVDNRPVVQRNNTGLPDPLKAGIESLSGMAMDHVRVHYNSSQPAQLNAHAYAQGSDIHLAPGQEKHLPHEAWHVVQQAQGRVPPTVQRKSRMSVNDDKSLEQEADTMGARAQAKAGAAAPPALARPSHAAAGSYAPVQAKIVLTPQGGDIPEDLLDHIRQRTTDLLDLNTVYSAVVATKPLEIQRLINVTHPDGIGADEYSRWLAKWNEINPTEYRYTDDETGYTKLAKDVIKYHLHSTHQWYSVGTAAYMTGDVTGLAIAAMIDPVMTVKVLKGKKSASEPHAPTIVRDGRLPASFDGARAANKIRETDVDAKPRASQIAKEFGIGTAGLYKYRYNQYTSPALKPWNKETYHATKSIGRHYASNQATIEDYLLPPETEKRSEDYARIRHFKSFYALGTLPCILIWQRLSGARGGAHVELDSESSTLLQMAHAIGLAYEDRAIVLVGDATGIDEEALRKAGVKNRIFILNEYWNSPLAKESKVFPSREHQNYFLKLLSTENHAISVGMRSGSLESSALLGIPTIYLDDIGNNAEGRMEYWAGQGAHTRNALFTNDGLNLHSDKELDKHEDDNKGPLPNYKRVGTRNQLGGVAQKRLELFKRLRLDLENIDPTRKSVGKDANGDPDIDVVIDALGTYANSSAKLDEKNLQVQVPILYKVLLKALNVFGQSSKSKKKNYSEESLKKLQLALADAERTAILSPNELAQIVYLVGHLSRQAPGTSAESGLDKARIEQPSDAQGSTLRLESPREQTPGSSTLSARPVGSAVLAWLNTMDSSWNEPEHVPHGGQSMLVGTGPGIMLGAAQSLQEHLPTGAVTLPPDLHYLINNGNGALCFIYSIVMGLTGASQAEVEPVVAQIATSARAGTGWIASDSPVAQRVIAEVERMFGMEIQVVEIQNSVTGPIISGRSHNVSAATRRPIVIRNTGTHYDAAV